VSPVDAAIIRRKLQHIVASIEGLRPLARLSVDEYRARFYERKAAERLLQEAIEAALDINAHLVAELGGEVPDDYYGGFLKIGALGILPRAGPFARPLRRAPEPPGPRVRSPRRREGARRCGPP